MSNWIPLGLVDWADPTIKALHIDTRDFHVSVVKDQEKINVHNLHDVINKLDIFCYDNLDQIKEVVNDLFTASGGEGEWRFLSLKGRGGNWDLKYLRIYPIQRKWVICTAYNKAIPKEWFVNYTINKVVLGKH